MAVGSYAVFPSLREVVYALDHVGYGILDSKNQLGEVLADFDVI